jgi:hypothetical protein
MRIAGMIVTVLLSILTLATTGSLVRSYLCSDSYDRRWSLDEPRVAWSGVRTYRVGPGYLLFGSVVYRSQEYTREASKELKLQPWAYRHSSDVGRISDRRFTYASFVPCWSSDHVNRVFGGLSYESWDHVVTVPHWMLVALFGAWPSVWTIRWRRRRQRAARGFSVIEKEKS